MEYQIHLSCLPALGLVGTTVAGLWVNSRLSDIYQPPKTMLGELAGLQHLFRTFRKEKYRIVNWGEKLGRGWIRTSEPEC